MKIAIVTACPSGVANSVLAAGLLEQAAKSLDWSATVECQSTVIKGNTLSATDISEADVVVLATSTAIDLTRFVGKKVYQSDISNCTTDPVAYLKKAVEAATELSGSQASSVNLDKADASTGSKKIVAITACPTGVAHTFMAAEALEETAAKLGYQIKVETRGSVGAKNQLTPQEIADADVVIIAADIELPLDRFDGKKMYKTSTGMALKKTEQEIDKAFATATVYSSGNTSSKSNAASGEKKGVYKHLMTGVSHMLPVVVAGGLIIALSFALGGIHQQGYWAQKLALIGGGTAFTLMIPVLAGYIAFSIADRPGLAPGLVGGMLAATIGSGFIGGIIAGFIAGYSAKLLADYIKLPQSMEALKPILIIPFIATVFTGLVMTCLLGEPIAWFMNVLKEFLQNMGAGNAIMLGVLLGAMMCFDLGGPINKAAYTFGVGLLASSQYLPMAAIMAAGMVPPLGMGLATFISRRKFVKADHEAGKAAFVLGLCFISEGAIPFAAKDPIRVIPSCMVGGAITGALSMVFGTHLMAPHGGLFVLLIPGAINIAGHSAISAALMYLAAIAIGTVITAVIYSFLKQKPEVAA